MNEMMGCESMMRILIQSGRNSLSSRETWTALGFLLPLVGFVGIFILVPVLGTLIGQFLSGCHLPAEAFFRRG